MADCIVLSVWLPMAKEYIFRYMELPGLWLEDMQGTSWVKSEYLLQYRKTSRGVARKVAGRRVADS